MVDEEKLRVAAAADCGIPWQTHQSAACQDYARSPDANFSADIKAANDHNGGTAVAYECTQTTDNKAVLLLSTSSSIACDDTVPSTSRADKAGASAGNSTRSPDANFSADIKAANDQNGGTAIAYECPQVTDNKTVLLLSTFSSIACDDAVPSTSRADQAGASTGNSASTADPNDWTTTNPANTATVSTDHFRNLTDSSDKTNAVPVPGYKSPLRDDLREKFLPHKVSAPKTKISSSLAGAEYICIALDVWTSRSMTGFLAVEATFVDSDFAAHTYLLIFTRLTESHTNARIRCEYDATLLQ
ncbi:hypothetical protein MRX96_014988 [Rhipicephalus microplus]